MAVDEGSSSNPTNAPQQYNQPSRKGKKAWRKNVDVTDVQKGLDVLNEEIIRGGVIKEKESSELFVIDLKGDSKSSTRQARKKLKVDEIISQRSAVPAVSLRKRPHDKTTDGIILAKRQRLNWVPYKELTRLRNVADGQHENTVAAKDATYDVWDGVAPKQAENASDFLPVEQRAKAPKTLQQQPITLMASGKHLRAVPNPSGSYSYNPAYSDYEKRLTEEGAKAVEAEKKRLAAQEADRLLQEAAARSAAEAEAAEQRADLSEWEEDSEWEGFQSGAEEGKSVAKQPKRKTQAQRNRIKRRKEDEQLAKHKAAMKARRIQEQKIRQIAEELELRDQERALALAEATDSDSDEGEERLRRKQLGKMRLPEKDLELILPDELQDSLRLLKPEGNLLKDRYRNMLIRGKVESRRHIPFKKQARKKITEKWTHKDFVL